MIADSKPDSIGCEVQSTISNQQSSILGGARRQPRVILWCVDIQRNQRIIDWDISDVLLMLVFDIAGNCCGGGAAQNLLSPAPPPAPAAPPRRQVHHHRPQ